MSHTFQLFIEPEKIIDNSLTIEGEDYNYLKNVLRASVNDTVELKDGLNNLFISSISSIEDKVLTLNISEKKEIDNELPLQIYLAQALPKSDKFDNIIQKCTELGVHEILPVQTKQCVVKIKDNKKEAKNLRWQKIAKTAALQCGRGIIPKINTIINWPKLIKKFSVFDLVILPFELEKKTNLKDLFSDPKEYLNKKILVIIGPEGGFAASEVEQAQKAGAKIITLGKRILRTETAAPAILAVLNYIYLD
jgi:16S rRNA (uracil1498-N3)-methyltransferase